MNKRVPLLLFVFSFIVFVECNAQQLIDSKNALIIIEKITYPEAIAREELRLKDAQLKRRVSANWKISSSTREEKLLIKSYQKIISGLTKLGVRYEIVNSIEFESRINTSNSRDTYFLTYDFDVNQVKRSLVIFNSFRLLNSEKKVLMDETPTGILKLISKNLN